MAIKNKHKRRGFIVGAAVVFLIVPGLGIIIKNNHGLTAGHSQRMVRVSVVQPSIPPLEKMDLKLFDRNAALHLKLTKQTNEQYHPDLIIWPETAFPDDLLQSETWRPVIFNEARRLHSNILIGIAPIINGKEYNSALLINSLGQAAGLYHKQALVPFAENTPLSALGISWGRGYQFSAGKNPGLFTFSSRQVRFGVVICSESAHPFLVRQLSRAGAQFIVEISNDGWFTDKASLMLHAQAAIMRAVENRVWVIRAANKGYSFAVDPDGVIHPDANLELGRQGFGIFDIMIGDR